jgi:cytochrome b involved in lipid metabolism
MDVLYNPIFLAGLLGSLIYFFFVSKHVKPVEEEKQVVLKEYTRDEVGKHVKSNDFWIIVGIIKQINVLDNCVYDVTEFLPLHPGQEAIYRGAGKDCSEKMREEFHPSRVWSSLDDYQIGTVPVSENRPILKKLNI